jgi:hypothetical protein
MRFSAGAFVPHRRRGGLRLTVVIAAAGLLSAACVGGAPPSAAGPSTGSSSPATGLRTPPAASISPPVQSAVQELGSGRQGYPRLIRLAHSGSADGELIASATAGNGSESIYRSTDDGRTFTRIGSVRDPAAAQGQCCGSIYELPGPVGALPPGTLLFAASFRQQARPMTLDLWTSKDHGAHWSEVSVIRRAPNNGGLWEPEMRLDAAGALVVYYSDETQQPKYSQALMETVSSDGTHWATPRPVVTLASRAARPGMAGVRTLENGVYFMTYEMCGAPYDCTVYDRTSANGLDWGPPTWPGQRVETADGAHLSHTPTFAVLDNGTATGEIVLAGRYYLDAKGKQTAGNGATLLVDSKGGTGPWTAIRAPLGVDIGDSACANYSSTLLPTSDGTGVIEIAQEPGAGICTASYATRRF